jgi:UDP-3-O-[3-hydroxymyristoyl] glucosamine N-acyltransferase
MYLRSWLHPPLASARDMDRGSLFYLSHITLLLIPFYVWWPHVWEKHQQLGRARTLKTGRPRGRTSAISQGSDVQDRATLGETSAIGQGSDVQHRTTQGEISAIGQGSDVQHRTTQGETSAIGQDSDVQDRTTQGETSAIGQGSDVQHRTTLGETSAIGQGSTFKTGRSKEHTAQCSLHADYLPCLRNVTVQLIVPRVLQFATTWNVHISTLVARRHSSGISVCVPSLCSYW